MDTTTTLNKGGNDIKQDILIILPKTAQSEKVCSVLSYHGIPSTVVEDVEKAIRKLESRSSAFLLLDLELEGAEAFLDEVVSSFYDPPPYLLVTSTFADSAMRTKILNRGADICLEKPLDEREVLAVINAVLRRSARFVRGPVKLAPCIVRKDLSIDPLRRAVIMEGRQVTLTSKEFDILYFLASYPGIVFSKDQIYEYVWNDDPQFDTTTVFSHISALRKKLGLGPKDTRYIETVFGTGYRFVAK